ncbi:MAG: alpha-ketoacid dehydrogenase subunit beta, partial [Candidatus Sungbacteria bacterium]|nr:alpha-ketoacid dehydrogenase subunit beta [Candidatus Sungbacteria bacterium]
FPIIKKSMREFIMTNKRVISYREALNEALTQLMEKDESVFMYGPDVDDHKRSYGTGNSLVEKYGPARCFSTPLSEEAITGIGIGTALNGMRPIIMHIRVDFMLIAMNQLANMAATICYGSNGRLAVPLVVRAVIGRGWGQGFQHSKSLQSIFAHIPGLKVVMPTTPYDAKGLLISSVEDNNPVVFLEHRWLYDTKGEVPADYYQVTLGKGNVLRPGCDLTVVATSWMNIEALKAADIIQRRGVNIEVIDPRSISPLDEELIISSVQKTGRCIVADYDWLNCGFSAEIAALLQEKCFGKLKSPIVRLGFAPTPCPTTRPLENEFYPNAVHIIRAVEKMLELSESDLSRENFYSYENRFKGPF